MQILVIYNLLYNLNIEVKYKYLFHFCLFLSPLHSTICCIVLGSTLSSRAAAHQLPNLALESQVSNAHFELRSIIGILRCAGQTNLSMADVASVDEEIKQEEIAVSVQPETEEACEETPNGVKT